MNIVNFIALFAIIWCVLIFVFLPIGVKTPDVVEEGHASSAPQNPRLGKKILLSGLASAACALGFLWLVEADVINFRRYFLGE